MPANRKTTRQSGNIFFALFGAVGLVGVLGAASTTIIKGPVRSMSEVTKNTVAENAMVAAGRLALVSAATQAQHGDCDNDQYIEPLPFSDTGTGPRPVGGGYLPPSIGAAQQDPWGSTYGYCSWDHGDKINDAGCGGAAQKRLRGSATEEKIALAVISAGPNRVFETSCGHDPAYLVRVSGSDDVILEYTYAESKTLGGVLWNLKENTVDTAEITKNLEVKNTGGNVVMAFDSTSAPSQPSLKVDFISKLTGAKKGVEFLSNIMLGANWLSGDGDNEGIFVASDGKVGVGTTAPRTALHVEHGNILITHPSLTSGLHFRTDGNRNSFLSNMDNFVSNGTSDNGYLTITSQSDLRLHTGSAGTSGTTRLVIIGDSGKVGIGTTAPNANALLDVAGAVTAGREGYSGTYNSAQVQGVWSMGPQYKIDTANNTFGNLYGTGYGYQTSATGAANTPITGWGHQMLNVSNGTVTSGVSLTSGHGYFAGNVGIGTQAPGAKLDVAGVARATSFTGVGTNLTALNATQLTSGTVPVARLSGSYTGITGTGALNAGSITSGFGNINIGTAALTAGTGTFSGAVNIATAPTANAHAANKAYVDANIATAGNGRFLPLSGGTLTGNLTMGGTSTINMNSSKIINLANPTANADAANKSYVDTAVSTAGNGRFLPLAGGTMDANALVQFGNQATDKIRWYSNTYGTGIEASTLTHWSAGNHRWRIGGTSVLTGTQYMLLNNTGLNVTGTVTARRVNAEAIGTLGIGVYSTGDLRGTVGIASGTDGAGIWGEASSSTGTVYGVYARVSSPNGYGVYSDGKAHVRGNLTVSGTASAATPTAGNHLATKAYVDAQAGGGAACTAGTLAGMEINSLERGCGYQAAVTHTVMTVTGDCPAVDHGRVALCTTSGGWYEAGSYQCWNGSKMQVSKGFRFTQQYCDPGGGSSGGGGM